MEVSVSVVALWSESDHLLSVLSPIGLAVGRDPSLVIDLDPLGPRYASPFTLADLVRDGPTRDQLQPVKRGVALLANGGVAVDEAAEVVGELAQRWPNVVLRCDPRSEPPQTAIAIVPLLPAPFTGRPLERTVFQQIGLRVPAPQGAVVLPRPRSATLNALTGLSAVPNRSRWIQALARLWAMA
jgi:hypothetical protein